MKTMKLIRNLFVMIAVLTANLTVLAAQPETDFAYNTEEVNGMKMSETVYKVNKGYLTNYEKYSYTYNDNKQVVENMLQRWDNDSQCWCNHMCIKYNYDENGVTVNYYKWNGKTKDFVHIPAMSLTLNQ